MLRVFQIALLLICAIPQLAPQDAVSNTAAWIKSVFGTAPNWLNAENTDILSRLGLLVIYCWIIGPLVIKQLRIIFPPSPKKDILILREAAMRYHGLNYLDQGGYDMSGFPKPPTFPALAIQSANLMLEAYKAGKLRAIPQDNGTFSIRYGDAAKFLKKSGV